MTPEPSPPLGRWKAPRNLRFEPDHFGPLLDEDRFKPIPIVIEWLMTYLDSYLRDILLRTRCIALIGVSPNPIRPSHFVGRYLSMRGYRVVPVNPAHAGDRLFGERIHSSIEGLPADLQIDMIDIFRRSEFVPPIVETALERLPGLRTVWMQIGVRNQAAAEMAEASGLDVIQDLCPKMEHQRLFGELRKAGFNTGVISSKL